MVSPRLTSLRRVLLLGWAVPLAVLVIAFLAAPVPPVAAVALLVPAGGAVWRGECVCDSLEAEVGQPGTATTWTLSTLREWGLDATVLRERRIVELLAANCRWDYENLPYWGGEVDCCINAWTLANGVWLGADVTGIAAWFIEHRLPDGGWNCEWVEGSTRSSFHSTLNSLTGLLAYDDATGGGDAARAARRSGEEYLLSRRLFRRLSTGEPVADWVTRYTYPFRWRYNVLNAAEYFRQACELDGGLPDPRMAEAIELIRAARQPDGTWLQAGIRAGCGSRSMCPRASPRNG